MRNRNEGWQGDFPRREEAEDCAGRMRSFLVDCHEGGLGFTVRAVEERHEGVGYEFAAYSETSPYTAPWPGQQKMARGCARQSRGPPATIDAADGLRGQMACAPSRMVLVVDGVRWRSKLLAEMLGSREGWASNCRCRIYRVTSRLQRWSPYNNVALFAWLSEGQGESAGVIDRRPVWS